MEKWSTAESDAFKALRREEVTKERLIHLLRGGGDEQRCDANTEGYGSKGKWWCTLPVGHVGPHIATADYGRWPDPEADPWDLAGEVCAVWEEGDAEDDR